MMMIDNEDVGTKEVDVVGWCSNSDDNGGWQLMKKVIVKLGMG